MSRAAAFKQSDVTRAVKGVEDGVSLSPLWTSSATGRSASLSASPPVRLI